jgi:hypothetical protein
MSNSTYKELSSFVPTRAVHSFGSRAIGKITARRAFSAAIFVLAMSASSGAMAQNCGPLTPSGTSFNFITEVGGGLAGATAIAATINATNSAFLTHSSAFVSAPGNPPADLVGGGVWARAIGGGDTVKGSETLNSTFNNSGTFLLASTRACLQLSRIIVAANCTPARKFLASLS